MAAQFAQLLLLMLAAHVIADFPLQPAALSVAKRPGGDPALPWPLALGGHSAIHAGAVAAITGSPWLGAAELAAHAGIDFAKGREWLGLKADQALHLLCKLAWALLAVGGANG